MKSAIKNHFARMQKYTLATLYVLCTLFFPVYAQEKEMVWDYPVKPGTDEWRAFKSTDEMYRACQIPDDVLKQLDTESLVDICLNFPAPPLFLLYNSPQEGFMVYYIYFNGIRELFQREDAGRYLLKKYAAMSMSDFDPFWPLHQQGRFASRYQFIEAILAQPQVVASLGAKGRMDLLKEAIRKMDEKTAKKDLFSGYGLQFNLWVIGRVVYHENKSLLQEFDQQHIQRALSLGEFVYIDADMLYQKAQKYAYENE